MSNIVHAQFDVTFTVYDGTESYQKIMLKGTFNEWAVVDMYDDGTNDDETAGDFIWTKTITGIMPDTSTHTWGCIEDDGSEWGIWLIEGDNVAFVLNEDGTVTGSTHYDIPGGPEEIDVTFKVVDGTLGYTKLMLKGSMYEDWTTIDMYDDGTIDDDVAGDHVWYKTITAIPIDDDYEWSVIEDDGTPQGIEILEESVEFSVDDAGKVTGDIEYIIKGSGPTTLDVTFTVTDSTMSYDSLRIKGTMYENWSSLDMYDDGTNDDATAGDHIWTITIPDLPIGSIHQWGVTEQDGSGGGIWLIEGGNPSFTVGADGIVSGDVSYVIPESSVAAVDVTFTVTDGTASYTKVMLKGTVYEEWTTIDMYDDGTNDDEVADDHIWTLTITNVPTDSTYEWGAIEDDDSEWGIWLIEGDNPSFKVFANGTVKGVTDYEIPPVVGISETNVYGYVIYPNPVSGVLHIKNLDNVEAVIVTNLLGQEIEAFKYITSDEFQINTSEYLNGVYFVTIQRKDGNTVSTKILKY